MEIKEGSAQEPKFSEEGAYKDSLDTLYDSLESRAPVNEISLSYQLTNILFETELPKEFEIIDITSTANSVVESKAKAISSVEELQGRIIPDFLIPADMPFDFEKENLEKAPWVNMIHAWMKVLNCMNGISAMQKGQLIPDPEIMAEIGHQLYGFTTDSDGEIFLRTNDSFVQQEEYVETKLRKSGVRGVNPQRHVNSLEMKYILDTIKDTFRIR